MSACKKEPTYSRTHRYGPKTYIGPNPSHSDEQLWERSCRECGCIQRGSIAVSGATSLNPTVDVKRQR